MLRSGVLHTSKTMKMCSREKIKLISNIVRSTLVRFARVSAAVGCSRLCSVLHTHARWVSGAHSLTHLCPFGLITSVAESPRCPYALTYSPSLPFGLSLLSVFLDYLPFASFQSACGSLASFQSPSLCLSLRSSLWMPSVR